MNNKYHLDIKSANILLFGNDFRLCDYGSMKEKRNTLWRNKRVRENDIPNFQLTSYSKIHTVLNFTPSYLPPEVYVNFIRVYAEGLIIFF